MEKLIVQISPIINNPIIKTGCLILLSLVFAKIADFIFSFFVKKIVMRTKSDIDDKIINYLHKPIYYSILFIGLSLTMQTLEQIPTSIEYILLGMFKSIVIVLWSFALFNIFMLLLKWYSKRNQENKVFNQSAIPLFDNVGKILIFLGAIYFILLSWNVDVTGWVASAGILSMVIGFGARDTIANLFSGIALMADAPYKEGDYINLDNGERGCVKSIGISSTRIITRDDIEITIPNSVIANSKIINESGGSYEKVGVRVKVGVAYGTEIQKVKDIVNKIAVSCNNVCETPPPIVRFREFGASSLNFELLAWIEKPEYKGQVTDELLTEIYNSFNANSIEIPFPQRTVHIKKTE